MKKYIKSSVTDLELDRSSIKEIESGLRRLVKKYFYDGDHGRTEGIRVSDNTYDILRYTARPYSGYRNMSASPMMNEDKKSLNEFKSEVRKFLKQFGVTRVKFATRKVKIHYGYVSGPDDFPVTCLGAIYFG